MGTKRPITARRYLRAKAINRFKGFKGCKGFKWFKRFKRFQQLGFRNSSRRRLLDRELA